MRLTKRIGCLLAVLLLALSGLMHAGASTKREQGRVVRVAFPIQQGLTYYDEYGNHTGYTYEYLEEIAQYTGWDYEFVEVPGSLDESLGVMLEMLADGEIDLMGAMAYSEDMSKQYDYAGHSYGVSETVLQVPDDIVQDFVINSQVEQRVRVAVLNTTGQRVQELQDYCEMNLITPELVLCESTEEQIQAVREGRADVLLNVSMNYLDHVRTVAKFSPKPFYFITTKGGNSGLMEELNSAILDIIQADPYFSTTLYEKYFSSSQMQLFLTDEETAYMEKAGKLKVGILQNQPPYQYEEDGALKGVSADFLEYVSQKTGLQFELINAATPEEVYTMAETGEINLIAGMPYDYDLARERNVSMTRPYLSSQYLLMMKESGSEESIKGKRLALVKSTSYRGKTLGSVVWFDTAEDCVRAVADGSADYTYVDAYTAQYYINQPYYRNLKLVPQTYTPRKVCFGVVKPGHQELLSILNKVVNNMSEVEIQGIINRNTIQKREFSLADLLWENPVEFVLVLASVSILIILILLYFLRQRVRMSRQNALELKKHFRVYALLNEYFFEYNFRKNTMVVSVPRKEEKEEPELLHYDYAKHGQGESGEFLREITSEKDGSKELYLNCIDGRYHWLRVVFETVHDGERPAYAIGKINVIDAEKEEKDTLLQKAQMDSLTHIYNAETSRTMIQQLLAQMQKNELGALIILDVDHFKSINDTYGHMEGDEVLKQIARLLREQFRSIDIVGRPGGDEFLVYMTRIKNREVLARKCDTLCQKVRELRQGGDGTITVSIGASLAQPGDSYQALYNRTDHALYEAKRLGRDRYAIWESGEQSQREEE